MNRNKKYRWLIGTLIGVFLIGGAVALAHGYRGDDPPYYGPAMGPLPVELEQAALGALDAEYASYAAYGAVIARYGEIEPYSTLKEISVHNIDLLTAFLERYGVEYPAANPYLERTALSGDLGEEAAALAARAADKGAMYGDIVESASAYRGIARLFSHLSRVALKGELPVLELAARSGGELSAARMDDLGFRSGRGPFGTDGWMEDEHCPWHDAEWGGRMGMHGPWARNGCR